LTRCKVAVSGKERRTLNSHYRIGEFAALTGGSVKTLRFYDEIGLLPPAGVGPPTRYRLYTSAQLEALASILALRDLGIPLAQIKKLTQGRTSVEERRELLKSYRASLQRSIHAANRSLRWMDAELSVLNDSTPMVSIVVKQRAELRVASVRSALRTY